MKPLQLTFLFALLCITVQAQQPVITSEYSYRHYTTQDGLPKLTIETLYQDSKGYIWIGSSAGAARFDGFIFKSFLNGKNEPVVRFSEVNHTNNGWGNRKSFTFLIDDNSTIIKDVSKDYYYSRFNSRYLPYPYAIYENIDATKKIFVTLTDSTIVKLMENETLNELTEFDKVYLDQKQQLLYLPTKKGVTVLSVKSGKQVSFYSNIRVHCFVNYQNNLWAIASNGLYKFENNQFLLVYPHFTPEIISDVKACVTTDGALIFCDQKNIYRFQQGRIETIFGNINQIRDMIIDFEGNIWVATYQGVYNLFRLQFRNYYLSDKQDMIRVVNQQADESVIIGTLDGKLIKQNKNQDFQLLNYPPNKFGNSFNSYSLFSTNQLYLPGQGKILKINPNNIEWVKNLPEQEYSFVTKLSNNQIIAGGISGIVFLDSLGKAFNSLNTAQLEQGIYSTPELDNKNCLWLGGSKGLNVIDGEKVKKIFSDTLKSVVAMTTDNKGTIWFASENRLFTTVNGHIKKYKQFDALITAIFTTKKDILVIPTLNGIHIFDIQNNISTFYNGQNGFTAVEPMRAGMFEDKDANVWMPALGALVCFNPEKLLYQQPTPRLQVLSFRISTDNIHWTKADSIHLKLNYKQTNLRISYIGLSYSQAQNVRYQYRLRGFQDQWSQPVAEREVTFNNLPPGRYTFELKCNAGTPETQTGVVSLPVYIKPAFWQTWLFKIAMFVLLAGLIAWLAIRYQRKKHAREIRKANREKEMNELRVQSVRLKSIPHFNSNVLAGIEYFIMTKSKEEANQLLTTYSRFTNITLHDIDKAQRSLKDELEYVRMYLGLEKMRYGDKLEYEIGVEKNVDESIMIPNMILHTFAENAVKHGIRGKNTAGKVQINVANERKGIRLTVEDNGVGRTESAKRNVEQNRTGQGLTILSRQIELYNQQNEEKIVQHAVDLTDENGNAAGTRFEMYVPYEYRYI